MNLTHLATCLLVLFMQYEMLFNKRLQLDQMAIQRMAQDQMRHYRMSRDSIEAINMRCHDIRHQIQSIGTSQRIDHEALERLSREVDVYDSAVRTGNDALDVILTEKSLICAHNGVTLSCIADGACIAFISSQDLYSLFGNALDNAIEAVREIPDHDRRDIGLVVKRSGDMASIHVENYYSGALDFCDGLPRTTKRDTAMHGYGMKSMRSIVSRYGGTLTCRAERAVFHLNALIPIPAEATASAAN